MSVSAKKTIFIGASFGVIALAGITLTMKRLDKHHNASMCATLHRLWFDPERTANDTILHDQEEYRDKGFFHVLFNQPPNNALERFKDMRWEDMDRQCLQKARVVLNNLIEESQ